MKDELKAYEAAIRADERAKVAKDATKLRRRSEALEDAAAALHLDLEKFTGRNLVERVAAASKPKSPRLSDEALIGRIEEALTGTPRPASDIGEIMGNSDLSRSQIQRGLKLLMPQGRVVRIGRKYQLVKEDANGQQ